MNLFESLAKGGPMMIFIGMCSIVMVAVTIERWVRLGDDRILPSGLRDRILELLRLRRYSEAMMECEGRTEIGLEVIRSGMSRAGASREIIREHFENAGRQVNQALNRWLGMLATVASISPLLGLMGTVLGMIRVFRVISIQGVGDPGALSGGISEALLTTAAGLAVGIPSLIIHNYFVQRVERANYRLEKFAADVLELLDRDGPLDTESAGNTP
ncbi:MotA/TolQ/ExbB proton channel family protein [bacterium]|nr:MotA/TolQ/ExbB proton channel family protein [candidate division CSSED10-310 bacterium]